MPDVLKGPETGMEIKIGKCSQACTACGRAFVHEETLTSAVRVENGSLLREDYCQSCWNGERSVKAFSIWSPRFYDPKVADQDPPEAFSPLRRIFYDSVEREERGELAVAYLAAQLLRRQKAFRLIKESDEGDPDVKMILFADRIGNRLIEVRDPSLGYAELEAGRQILMERLAILENPPDGAEEGAAHAQS